MVFKERLFLAAVLAALTWPGGPATATVYTFQQSGTTVPGLSVESSITMNGTIADMPTVSWMTYPADFGALTAFTFHAPALIQRPDVTLADFVSDPSPSNQFLRWYISSNEILFNDSSEDFEVVGFGSDSTITMNTDAPSPCNRTGRCVITGSWEPVPEPPAAVLLATGLLALGPIGWRSRRRARATQA